MRQPAPVSERADDGLEVDAGSVQAIAIGYLSRLNGALAALDLDCIDRMSSAIVQCYAASRTVYCVGNGGSAATASHLAADLTKLTSLPGRARRLRSLCLSDSMAAVTAASNDFSYEQVFVEQLRAFLEPGDVVVGISTSGRSSNVLRALEYAADNGAVALAITGRSGSELRTLAHETLVIDSASVQRIEDVTMVAAHLLCVTVRARCGTGDVSRQSAN
jgi:D-sedoheptulose 7-phosphate isomerase